MDVGAVADATSQATKQNRAAGKPLGGLLVEVAAAAAKARHALMHDAPNNAWVSQNLLPDTLVVELAALRLFAHEVA